MNRLSGPTTARFQKGRRSPSRVSISFRADSLPTDTSISTFMCPVYICLHDLLRDLFLFCNIVRLLQSQYPVQRMRSHREDFRFRPFINGLCSKDSPPGSAPGLAARMAEPAIACCPMSSHGKYKSPTGSVWRSPIGYGAPPGQIFPRGIDIAA